MTSANSSFTSDVVPGERSEVVRWVFVFLGAVTCANGVFGNVLTLCALVREPLLRSAHNVIIGHLAVADLFIVGYAEPFWIWDVAADVHPTVNATLCIVNGYLSFAGCAASILFLWTISLHRYVSICQNAVYRKLQVTRWRTSWSCALVWVTAAFAATLPFAGMGEYIYETKFATCFLNRSDPNVTIAITIPTVAIMGSIAFFNISIFRLFRQSKKRVDQWRLKAAPVTSKEGDADLETAPTTEKVEDHHIESSEVTAAHGAVGTGHIISPTDQEVRGNGENLRDVNLNSVEPQNKSDLDTSPDSQVNVKGSTQEHWASEPSNVTTVDKTNVSLDEAIVAAEDAQRSSGNYDVYFINGNQSERFQANSFHESNQSAVKNNVSLNSSSLPLAAVNTKVNKGTKRVTISSPKATNTGNRDDVVVTHNHATKSPTTSSSADKSLVSALFAVYICLVVFYVTTIIVGAVEPLVKVPEVLGLLSSLFFFTNSSVNWFLYAAFNQTFRHSYKRFLTDCSNAAGRWKSN